METNVRFVRLKNGDDILTEAIEHYSSDTNEHFYQLVNPLRIVYFNNPNSGGMAVGLVNWISSVFATEQTFNIDKADILVVTEVSNDILKNYYSTLEDISSAQMEPEVELTPEEVDDEFDAAYESLASDKKHYH